MNDNAHKQMTIKLSELLYLLYFGLMLFAKGIGLYDGQTVYKAFLLLAFACIAVKMCITEYTNREWIIILFLLGLAAVIYRVSGEKGILIGMVTVMTMKQVSLKRVFQTGCIVWMIAMAGRFLLSLLFIGQVQTAVQTKNFFGALLRYFMGYPHPNVLHISYFVLTAFVIYCLKDHFNWKHALLLMIGNGVLFLYSYSFTGTLIVTVYLVLSLWVSRRELSRMEYWLAEAVFPLCVLFSVVFPVVLTGRAYELADKFFNNRINFARHFLTLQNMSLLGNNLAEITTDIITMDNSFVFALVIYGIPVFALICVGYVMMVHRLAGQKRKMELAMTACFLIAGITEPFLFNTSFKNLTLLLIGEQFFELLKQESSKEKALIQKWNLEIALPTAKIDRLREQIIIIWSDYRKRITVVSIGISILVGILFGVCYQPRADVLAVQKDHLLFFERMRVTMTAFSITWIVSLLLLLIFYGIKERKMEIDKNENHA